MNVLNGVILVLIILMVLVILAVLMILVAYFAFQLSFVVTSDTLCGLVWRLLPEIAFQVAWGSVQEL